MEITNASMDCDEATCTPPKIGWQSPRISFCQDISSDRVSPEKRKREELPDDYSTEFEFCMVQSASNPAIFGETMLSADELFLDGKLLPLHIPPQFDHQETDSLNPAVLIETETTTEMETEAESVSIARHINLENTQPTTTTTSCASNTVPLSPKSSKLSYRWKEIFKLGKLQVKESQCPETLRGVKEEGSNKKNSASYLKQPLSPRSIWPFSRSSSAGDAKANSASCSLASSRSNSAGDNSSKPKASSAPCSRSNSGGDSKSKARNGFSSRIHVDFNTKTVSTLSSSSTLSSEAVDSSVGTTEQEAYPCPNPIRASNTQEDEKTLETMPKAADICNTAPPNKTRPSNKKQNGHVVVKEKKSPKKTSADGVMGSTTVRTKGCASPGRTLRMRSPSGNFGRGSPVRIAGRSGAGNGSPGRVGSGKFMIRNLERCTANSKNSVKCQDSVWPGRQKEGTKVSERTNSYSTGVRVLNVPVCIGHRGGRVSNNRLFNFRGLFSKKVS
eukprot:Gb_26184 [translate_table: standard]